MTIPTLVTSEVTPEKWDQRRAELLSLLGTYEYGITPDLNLNAITLSETARDLLSKRVEFTANQLSFVNDSVSCKLRFEVYASCKAKKLPVIVLIDVFDHLSNQPQEVKQMENSANLLPYQMIIERGYAIVVVHPNDICADSLENYDKGIMKLAPKVEESSWGAIGVWAWGTSRVIDILLQDSRFNSEKIAVMGVSRAGKTALWCGAQDERIHAVISTVSGCGGASLLRKGRGERLKDMTKNFPYWTCDKFATFAEYEEELPIDQHMLLAACAPRPLYLSDAIEDEWCDGENAFNAAILAGEAYRILGRTGLSQETFPTVNTPLIEGDIAYHIRSGAHGILKYDWLQYLKFLDKYF